MTTRITTAGELQSAALNKQSVTCEQMHIGPLPAAFVLNMNFMTVSLMFQAGLFVNPKKLKFFKKKKGAKCPK